MTDSPRILITGGAGFIGTNLAKTYLEEGRQVTLLDNLSRNGVEENLAFLQRKYKAQVKATRADVRDRAAVLEATSQADVIYHLAAQVAVTTSLTDPVGDFSINAGGTLNVLEGARLSNRNPVVVFTSTNKVYGSLDDIRLRPLGSRYTPVDALLSRTGIDESRSLDFHSPYGCSKGAADQYVLDYGRCYGFRSVVFRMSCICGPHQQGTEDQGWVAFFVRRMIQEKPLTIYGDGLQVRDVLFVSDLVRAFRLATETDALRETHVFNMGGGPERAASVLDVIELIRQATGIAPQLEFGPARTGDQRWYVSNHARFSHATGWRPQMGLRDSIARLVDWFSVSNVSAVTAMDGAERCVTL
jgi:CDP-paratose 2-epimerase